MKNVLVLAAFGLVLSGCFEKKETTEAAAPAAETVTTEAAAPAADAAPADAAAPAEAAPAADAHGH